MTKILIAGREENSGELRKVFEDSGHEAVFVENGSEVIDRVYLENPQIIILDLHYSKPSGLEILEKLKSAPSTREMPVILIASRNARSRIRKGIELGAYDYISKPFFREVILARIRNVSYIRGKMKEVESLLVRDYLTGLYNRKFFMERLQEELSWAVIYREPFSVLILDIDHFKRVNDTYGHSCGDEVLQQVAQGMQSAIRPQDIVARYGGEEFIVLLPGIDSEKAAAAGEKVRLAIQDSEFICRKDNIQLKVTVSIGINTFEGNMDLSQDNLITQADKALYDAKSGGRNRVVIYRH
jgi:diguanylate cyclase (GGDEF)-like protein